MRCDEICHDIHKNGVAWLDNLVQQSNPAGRFIVVFDCSIRVY